MLNAVTTGRTLSQDAVPKVCFRPKMYKNANRTACERHLVSQNALQGVFSRSGIVKRPLKTSRSRVFTQPRPRAAVKDLLLVLCFFSLTFACDSRRINARAIAVTAINFSLSAF
jgi:hypothetical protein